jgi:hypothetical protein
MSRYEIKQNGVFINTIMASAEFVAEHFPSELYEATLSPTDQMVREERDELLVEVDAVAGNALRWAELDSTEQAAWSTYRQALLDVPQQAGFPNTVTWPTKP